MSREVHVQFCERLEVKSLWPTHPYIQWRAGSSVWRLWSIGSPAGPFVVAVDHTGRRFLPRSRGGGARKNGRPKIFNTDQGSQFTSSAFTGLLLENAIAVRMDGRGAWRDSVFVQCFWRSVKYEGVLRAYDSVGEARASLSRYFTSTIKPAAFKS
jgi:transposase InsO family protein